MSTDAIAVLGFVVLFVLMLLRVPVGMAMGLVGVSGFAWIVGGPAALKNVGHTTMRTVTDYNFAVVPLFLLMGAFATTSGMSRELFRAANAFLGHLRGGLGIATIAACGGFAAICGSSVATAATFSKVAYPEMRAFGYPQTFDVLFGKRYAADEEEQRLLGHARIGSPEWAAELETLVALGCPHLVLRVLDRSGVEKESAAIRPTFLRALLKAGQRERLKAAAPRAWFSRLEPALHGRVHHALGDDRAAERAYDKAARRDDPDIRFLKAMLRVGRRSWRDAAREFDAMLEADPDSLRARAGRAMCVAQSGTGEDLRAELRRWVESRRPSTTGDEADAWMRHIDSAGTAPPDQDTEPD